MNSKWIEKNYYEVIGLKNINKVKSYYIKSIENQPWFRPIIRTFVESFNLEPMSRYCVRDVLEYLNQAVIYEFLRDYYD